MMVMRQDIAMSDRGIWTASSYDGAGDSDSHSLIMKMFPLPFCFAQDVSQKSKQYFL